MHRLILSLFVASLLAPGIYGLDDDYFQELNYLLGYRNGDQLESRLNFNKRRDRILKLLKRLKNGATVKITGKSCFLTPDLQGNNITLRITCKSPIDTNAEELSHVFVQAFTPDSMVPKAINKKYASSEHWAIYIDENSRKGDASAQKKYTGSVRLTPHAVLLDSISSVTHSGFDCAHDSCPETIFIGGKVLSLEIMNLPPEMSAEQ